MSQCIKKFSDQIQRKLRKHIITVSSFRVSIILKRNLVIIILPVNHESSDTDYNIFPVFKHKSICLTIVLRTVQIQSRVCTSE